MLDAFKRGDEILGKTTASSPDGRLSLYFGIAGLCLGWLLVSPQGRRWIESWKHRRRAAGSHRSRSKDFSDWTERRLSGASVLVAFLVGGAINLPSPVYLLALGKIATGAHGPAGEAGLVLLFNAIMFGLVELPLLGYLLRPRETAARVAAFSTWLNANGIRVVGFVVVLFSVSLILQGLGAAI